MRFKVSQTIVVLAFVGFIQQLNVVSANKPKQVQETVLITYHVIPGKEKELQKLLATAWKIYQKDKLVLAQPHVVISEKEGEGRTRVVEIFTWVNAKAPDNAPDSVKKLWDQMKACCEKRGGHEGLEGGEVELLVPLVATNPP
jgi:hypothetical protein